ncbi:hypothetical protein Sjap_003076 [Stephania japonica]|uniref:Uncharacterized protein n=1 Tax=Stephania japonica TaxID=461633 RepID=A0AAP0KN87_9MAGN
MFKSSTVIFFYLHQFSQDIHVVFIRYLRIDFWHGLSLVGLSELNSCFRPNESLIRARVVTTLIAIFMGFCDSLSLETRPS